MREARATSSGAESSEPKAADAKASAEATAGESADSPSSPATPLADPDEVLQRILSRKVPKPAPELAPEPKAPEPATPQVDPRYLAAIQKLEAGDQSAYDDLVELQMSRTGETKTEATAKVDDGIRKELDELRAWREQVEQERQQQRQTAEMQRAGAFLKDEVFARDSEGRFELIAQMPDIAHQLDSYVREAQRLGWDISLEKALDDLEDAARERVAENLKLAKGSKRFADAFGQSPAEPLETPAVTPADPPLSARTASSAATYDAAPRTEAERKAAALDQLRKMRESRVT